jgi:hypothetical protein
MSEDDGTDNFGLTDEQIAAAARIMKQYPLDKRGMMSTPPDPSEGEGQGNFLGQLEQRLKEEAARVQGEKQ